MKRLLIVIMLLGLTLPARAAEIEPPALPEEASVLMPEELPGFVEGLWYVTKTAIAELRPDLAEGSRLCLSAAAIAMLISVVSGFPGKTGAMAELVGVVGISTVLLTHANTLIDAGAQAVEQISSYGRLLLPVMCAAFAAQGGTTGSAALYTGTAFFDALLSGLISNILVPLVYVFLGLSVACGALEEDFLKKLRELSQWLVSWLLKTVLYIFTGYMTVTGVITGGTDKMALKAAKLTISGAVPVVGSIMSDASETILVGAGVVKNTVGVYGLVALIAITILPFLRIGLMYLLLKLTGAVCSTFSGPRITGVLQSFSQAMGLLLAMTGTVCLLFLIGVVCFLKGMNG